MKDEIEAKFLDLDHGEMREQLRAAGAILEHPMRLMRRVLFDYPDKRLQEDNWGRLRVRDEGDKITVTYKSGGDTEYSKEIETTVGSFENMCQIFETIGLQKLTFQESKRETWLLDDVEVVLDEWPWLNTYIEIEGPTEPAIQDAAKKLGLEWNVAYFGNVDVAYRVQYPGMAKDETVGAMAELHFDGEQPDWLRQRQSV